MTDTTPTDNITTTKYSLLGMVGRIVVGLILLIILIIGGLIYFLSTQAGTQWGLNVLRDKAGVKLRYVSGDLYRGVAVADVVVKPTDKLIIQTDNAFLKLGWRTLLAGQVSMVDTYIGQLDIINLEPSTGEPFAFDPLSLPLTLHAKNAHVKTLALSQANKDGSMGEPLYLYDIDVDNATWQGSRIDVSGGGLDISREVLIKDVQGYIDFTGDYPLQASAKVTVNAITEHAYFDTIEAQAHGTLKRAFGTVQSKYNKQPISGKFTVQPLSDKVPFSASLGFDEVVLPYAEEQGITLKQGIITARGVMDKIELRANTDLSAKDIPKGHYQARGVVTWDDFVITRLTADTASGQLIAHADMSWQDTYRLNATIQGNHYRIRDVMPLEYRDYQAYLPKDLTGALSLNYFYLDKKANETRWEFDLKQKDGEHLTASLAQRADKPDAPWQISATWANLLRDKVPYIDDIDSPNGSADLILADGLTTIKAKGNINRLSVAPKGSYDITAKIEKGEKIHLNDVAYQGVIGDLTAKGLISLASKTAPLSWQFDINSKKLTPNAYFDAPNTTPFDNITGKLSAQGKMILDRKDSSIATHDVQISRSDLTAHLAMTDKPQVHLVGKGDVSATLRGSELTAFDVDFAGDVAQTLVPKLDKLAFALNAKGTPKSAHIYKLTANNNDIKASVAGDVGFADAITWDLKARLDELNTAKFANGDVNLIAHIVGDVSSKGAYKDKLQAFDAQFTGQVGHDKLPKGDLGFLVSGKGNQFDIKYLTHKGEAGDLKASGSLDLDRLAWQADAQMQGLNLGHFVRGLDSELSGKFTTQGVWLGGKNGQLKSFSVDGLDLSGRFRGQDLSAKGSLSARLLFPKDLTAYFNNLKSASVPPRTPSELINIQRQVEANTRQTQQIVQALNADNLVLSLGNNVLTMNGTQKNLTTTADIKDLSQLVPSAQGIIKGGVVLVNDSNALPTLYIDLTAKDIRTADIIVQRLSALGKVENLARSPSQLLIESENVIAMGRVMQSARLDFQGTQDKHHLSLTTKSANVVAKLAVDGGLDNAYSRYQGVLRDGLVQTSFGLLAQRQPAQFSYTVSDSGIKVAPHCWHTGRKISDNLGSLCLQKTLSYTPTSGNVDLVVQNLDTSVLSAVLPSDMVWRSILNGKVQALWQKGTNPTVNAVLYSDNGRVGITQDDTGYVEMPYERVSVIAQTVSTGLKLRTDIAGGAGRGYADVIIDPYKAGYPISGAVAINDINLAVLRPFVSDLQTLAGVASLAGGVGGTLSKPLFYGDANLTDGQLAVVGVPLALSDIQADLAIRGTQASLTGTFRGGEGKGELSGQIDWQNALQAKLGIKGDKLTINSPPLITAEFSPDLEIIVRPLQQYVNVQGVVIVPSATIRPPRASESIVTKSPDVSVIDRRMTGNVAQILAVSAPWSINADIGLDLGGDVSFRGFGAKLPLAGTLHLTQSGQGAMTALGVVQVSERTKVDGIGQNIELNYAQVRFNGDMLNPRLSIEGEKEIQGTVVGVRIKGTANNPDITVFNDGGLTEQQAMNALITGRIDESQDAQTSEQAFRSQVTDSLAAAGLSLGLAGTRGVTNQIGQALGLESLTLDASGGNVNVTGYITPDLYIRYGVGVFNAQSALSMRYQLTRRLYVEATQAVENSVDVIYQWKF